MTDGWHGRHEAVQERARLSKAALLYPLSPCLSGLSLGGVDPLWKLARKHPLGSQRVPTRFLSVMGKDVFTQDTVPEAMLIVSS